MYFDRKFIFLQFFLCQTHLLFNTCNQRFISAKFFQLSKHTFQGDIMFFRNLPSGVSNFLLVLLKHGCHLCHNDVIIEILEPVLHIDRQLCFVPCLFCCKFCICDRLKNGHSNIRLTFLNRCYFSLNKTVGKLFSKCCILICKPGICHQFRLHSTGSSSAGTFSFQSFFALRLVVYSDDILFLTELCLQFPDQAVLAASDDLIVKFIPGILFIDTQFQNINR